MSEHKSQLVKYIEAVETAMAAVDKARSELAPASGSVRLLLNCPDCGADEWSETMRFDCCYQCLSCERIGRHQLYSVPYLQGYQRGKREAQNKGTEP